MLSSARMQLVVGVFLECLLLGLVVLLTVVGDRSLSGGQSIYVDFDRVENLKEGAQVRISGELVGRVLSIRQGVGRGEPPPLARVRVELWLERGTAHHVRRSSVFYVSSRGVVGERHVEIGPSSGDPQGAVRPGEVLRGVDAPPMDRLIQHSYNNLRMWMALLDELRPDVHSIVESSGSIRRHLDEIAPPDRLARLKESARRLAEESRALRSLVLAGTDELRAPRRLAGQLEELWHSRGPELEGASQRASVVAARVEPLLDLLRPEERARLDRTLGRLHQAAANASHLASHISTLWAFVEAGRGTIGRLLTDPELDGDVKEAHRLLKEGPWRVLAKPGRDQAPRGQPQRRPSDP